MIVIPAVDLSDGKCVRLLQGRKEDITRYGDDPVEFARQWERDGAELLHLVDLDGAIDDACPNYQVVRAITEALQIPVELGGGMRSLDAARQALEMGVRRIIVGTLAIREPDTVAAMAKEFGGDRIVVGIDAVDGKVAVRGWTDVTEVSAIELAGQVADWGIQTIIFTDIGRDGMLTGPNIPALREVLDATPLRVLASGGISQLDDIRALVAMQHPRLEGVITGKALYELQFTLPEAVEAAAGK
jgi:phosphoribosylformimino-5-aminoimidazole carboxamide ribotide isomerase